MKGRMHGSASLPRRQALVIPRKAERAWTPTNQETTKTKWQAKDQACKDIDMVSATMWKTGPINRRPWPKCQWMAPLRVSIWTSFFKFSPPAEERTCNKQEPKKFIVVTTTLSNRPSIWKWTRNIIPRTIPTADFQRRYGAVSVKSVS